MNSSDTAVQCLNFSNPGDQDPHSTNSIVPKSRKEQLIGYLKSKKPSLSVQSTESTFTNTHDLHMDFEGEVPSNNADILRDESMGRSLPLPEGYFIHANYYILEQKIKSLRGTIRPQDLVFIARTLLHYMQTFHPKNVPEDVLSANVEKVIKLFKIRPARATDLNETLARSVTTDTSLTNREIFSIGELLCIESVNTGPKEEQTLEISTSRTGTWTTLRERSWIEADWETLKDTRNARGLTRFLERLANSLPLTDAEKKEWPGHVRRRFKREIARWIDRSVGQNFVENWTFEFFEFDASFRLSWHVEVFLKKLVKNLLIQEIAMWVLSFENLCK